MNESQSLRIAVFVVLALLTSYLVAFFFWGWFKVRQARQNTTPEQPPLKATPQGLEHETAWLIQESTGKTARVLTGIDKGLIDIEILDNAGQVRGIVQCVPLTMAYSFTPGNVQALRQVKRSQGVKSAYLVTKGRFEYAVQLETKRLHIKLLDGASLERLRRRVTHMPLDLPSSHDLFEDHSRWQRPESSGVAPDVPALRSYPSRHVVVPRTPPVVIPTETTEADAPYKPSVKPTPAEEKTSWPTPVSYKRNLPTIIIKPIPTETVMLDSAQTIDSPRIHDEQTPQSDTPQNEPHAESSAFYEAQRMLQARKYKPVRTTQPGRSRR